MSDQIDPKTVPQKPDVSELPLDEMDLVSGGIRIQEQNDKTSEESKK